MYLTNKLYYNHLLLCFVSSNSYLYNFNLGRYFLIETPPSFNHLFKLFQSLDLFQRLCTLYSLVFLPSS